MLRVKNGTVVTMMFSTKMILEIDGMVVKIAKIIPWTKTSVNTILATVKTQI